MKFIALVAISILIASQSHAAPKASDKKDIPLPVETSESELGEDFQGAEQATPGESNIADDLVIPSENIEEEVVRSEPEPDNGETLRVRPYFSVDPTPKLQKKTKEGAFIYKTRPSPQKMSGGFKLGPQDLSRLSSPSGVTTYPSIYGNSKPIALTIDFEYQFLKGFGKMGARAGFGFMTAQGYGVFLRNNEVSEQPFTLYVFPLSLSLTYHLQFWEKQFLVPFGEVGGDYFAMSEYRNDKEKLAAITTAGAMGWHWTVGAQIQLDALSKEDLWQMDAEYGINHIYLVADMRQVIGLNSHYDFTSLIFEGGILFEF